MRVSWLPGPENATKDLTQEIDWRGVILRAWVEKHTAQTGRDGGHYRCNGACTLGTHARVEACHVSDDGATGTESLKARNLVLEWMQFLVG